MSAALLGIAWSALAVAMAVTAVRRGCPARARELVSSPAPTGDDGPRRSPAAAVGSALRRLAHRPPDAAADRRVGWAALAGAVAGAVWTPGGPAVAAAVWLAPAVAAARAGRRRDDRLVADLPEVVDLVALAVGAGLTVPLAVTVVARRAPGELGAALRRVASAMALGRRAADALDDLGALAGEAARPLAAALAASERYGVPLGPSLAVLAAEVRADRRRRAEAAARRVPVKLLFPLVLCVLPAFGLLTVVPLLGGAATSLDL